MKHLPVIEAQEAELRQDVYEYLCPVYTDLDGDEVDVRLQVTVNAGHAYWTVHTGDASYDQDHRGYWGAETLVPDMDEVAVINVAMSLVEQAIDHCAQGE